MSRRITLKSDRLPCTRHDPPRLPAAPSRHIHIHGRLSVPLEPRWIRRAATDSAPEKLATVADVQAALRKKGVTLTVKELGPLYRITCRNEEDDKIMAVTNGWINPLPRFMHCETLQVFSRGKGRSASGRSLGGMLGLGVFVGVATFAYARSQGCSRAEILAINDSDDQHAKLLKYYTHFGFKAVKTVGENGFADLPDQVVWGGVGTRMDADVLGMLRRWGPLVLRTLSESAQ